MRPLVATTFFVQLLCIYNFVRSQGYLGCYYDPNFEDDPMLGHRKSLYSNIDIQLTSEKCIAYCRPLGYKYVALLAPYYCYCGAAVNETRKLDDKRCDSKCAANITEMCGGFWAVSVHKIQNPITGYNYLGCYKEKSSSNQALSRLSQTFTNLPWFLCLEWCKELGFLYGGLQNRDICFCVNQIKPYYEKVEEEECNLKCTADKRTNCGGFWRSSIYLIAVCDTPCQNGGTCVSRNTCNCPPSFYGSYCQYEGEHCAQPPTPANAYNSCGSTSCTITCIENYEFPDGSTTLSLSCKEGEGKWKQNRSDWSSIPDCKVRSQEYIGCYNDVSMKWKLGHYKYLTALTSERCTDYCQRLGYTYALLQAGVFCNCVDDLTNEKDSGKTGESDCNISCTGDKEQICGGDLAASAYKINNPRKGYKYLGCFSQLPNQNYSKEFDNLIPTMCTDICKEMGYVYAGVKNGTNCICGNSKHSNDDLARECNSICSGDGSKTCGGSNRIAVYFTGVCLIPCQNGGFCDSSNVCTCPAGFYGTYCEYDNRRCGEYGLTPANATKSCDSKTCIIMCVENYEFPNGRTLSTMFCEGGRWVLARTDRTSVPDCIGKKYLGCYREASGKKMFGHAKVFNTTLTASVCLEYCTPLGYSYFGLQYRSECFCGEVLPDSNLKVDDSLCNYKCPGDQTQMCGASGRNSVYKIADPTEGFPYLGCYDDTGTRRILNDFYKYFPKQTPNHCIEFCKQKGSPYAGLQSGAKCYCGTLILSNRKKLAEEECNTKCSGDPYRICGGDMRVSIYATKI